MDISNIVRESETLMRRPYREMAAHCTGMIDLIWSWLELNPMTVEERETLKALHTRLQKHRKAPTPPPFLGSSAYSGL